MQTGTRPPLYRSAQVNLLRATTIVGLRHRLWIVGSVMETTRKISCEACRCSTSAPGSGSAPPSPCADSRKRLRPRLADTPITQNVHRSPRTAGHTRPRLPALLGACRSGSAVAVPLSLRCGRRLEVLWWVARPQVKYGKLCGQVRSRTVLCSPLSSGERRTRRTRSVYRGATAWPPSAVRCARICDAVQADRPTHAGFCRERGTHAT